MEVFEMSENYVVDLIKLNLASDDDNYTFCITEWPVLQELDDEQFISQLATLNYTEQIDWSSLNSTDIKELRDFLTDECGD
jgi:hypothetical protein